MPNQEPLSRSGITSLTGVPNDVLTYWIRYGLVRPIYAPSGMGRHLRFEWYEANIAAVMNQLRILGFQMDAMLSIAAVYRDAILWAARYELSVDDVYALWSAFNIEAIVADNQVKRKELQAIVNREGFDRDAPANARLVAAAEDYPIEDERREMIEGAAREHHGARRVTDRIIEICATMPREEFRQHLDSFLTITEQPVPGQLGLDSGDPGELTYFWRAGPSEDYRFAHGGGAAEMARQDGATSMIAVDVTAILYKVWNPQEAPE